MAYMHIHLKYRYLRKSGWVYIHFIINDEKGKAEYGLFNTTDTTLKMVSGRMALKPDNYMYVRLTCMFFLNSANIDFLIC